LRKPNENHYSHHDLEVAEQLGGIKAQVLEGNRRFDSVEKGISALSGQIEVLKEKVDEHTRNENETWTKFSAALSDVSEKVVDPKIPIRPLLTNLVAPVTVIVVAAILLNWWLHMYGP
jgi:hypothetical protein